MKKYLILLLTLGMIGLQSCDSDDTLVGGGFDEPDPLVGCEATTFYDWADYTFETALDGGATTWLGFELEETTLFSINLNQAGFNCSIYESCDGEYGSPPALYSFETNGNGVEVGIVTAGSYYLEILNTRPTFLDFTFSISLADIVYGCLDTGALNYNETANVDDGSCEYNDDCDYDYWVEAYGAYASEVYFPMVLDCNGNCAPESWIGDTYCDDGSWGIYNENGEIIPIVLQCEEFNFDEGDCEEIIEGCPEGTIEDCNLNCAPASWLGDGFCDDGSYQYNGNDIYFNCEIFNNDEGDCDSMGRSTQFRPYPKGRIQIND